MIVYYNNSLRVENTFLKMVNQLKLTKEKKNEKTKERARQLKYFMHFKRHNTVMKIICGRKKRVRVTVIKMDGHIKRWMGFSLTEGTV